MMIVRKSGMLGHRHVVYLQSAAVYTRVQYRYVQVYLQRSAGRSLRYNGNSSFRLSQVPPHAFLAQLFTGEFSPQGHWPHAIEDMWESILSTEKARTSVSYHLYQLSRPRRYRNPLSRYSLPLRWSKCGRALLMTFYDFHNLSGRRE
jgi:hypothetical protein